MTRRNFLLATTALPLVVAGVTISTAAPTARTTASPLSSLDRARLLDCIAQVESGRDDTKIGPRGERSKYQISSGVWYDRTRCERPFYMCYGVVAQFVAEQHIEWLLHNGVIAIVYDLAFAWHHGLTTWRRASSCNSAFAQRVQNLYYDPRS